MRFKDSLLGLPAYRPPHAAVPGAAPITRLGANENPLGPSPRAVAAMSDVLSQVHRYSDAGSWPLRVVLGAHFDIAPEQVFCTNGSDELIFLLCNSFLEVGDEAVIADGSFISYQMKVAGAGGIPVMVPLRDYAHDLDAMADAITDRTRLVFICNPNNPTGTTVDSAAVARFLARVPDDVLVVADEAYVEFIADGEDTPDFLAEVRAGRKNLIVLRTFAKIYGLAGLRLGYAFSSPEVIAYLDRARTVFNVNLLAQVAAPAALEDTDHVARVRAHAAAARKRYTAELTAMGLTPIRSATNFMTVIVEDDAAIAAGLLERGIMVNPLSAWGLPGHIRISFGTNEENERFFVALRDVLSATPAAV
jgi:histidinol-phosphate aminotransferase